MPRTFAAVLFGAVLITSGCSSSGTQHIDAPSSQGAPSTSSNSPSTASKSASPKSSATPQESVTEDGSDVDGNTAKKKGDDPATAAPSASLADSEQEALRTSLAQSGVSDKAVQSASVPTAISAPAQGLLSSLDQASQQSPVSSDAKKGLNENLSASIADATVGYLDTPSSRPQSVESLSVDQASALNLASNLSATAVGQKFQISNGPLVDPVSEYSTSLNDDGTITVLTADDPYYAKGKTRVAYEVGVRKTVSGTINGQAGGKYVSNQKTVFVLEYQENVWKVVAVH